MNPIRTANQTDLESIIEIYNHAINSRFETAEINEVKATDRLDWFSKHKPDTFPIFVYEKEGKILGWFSFSPYRELKEALKFTIEISYYIHKDFQRQGIGTELMEFALNTARTMGIKTFFAIILEKNERSIQFLKKFGFEQWAHLPNVANFNGEECGHVYLGRRL
jgi:phosphinothricin acetyltransferase